MSIKENIRHYEEELSGTPCRLIAVSKTKPNELLQEAYDAGQRDFGENKVQELAAKAEVLPKDIKWHMVGHLQRNKVKYIAPFVHMIHSVDSLRLLLAIDKEARKNDRLVHVLLQIHIARESTKFGLNRDEAIELLASESFKQTTHVHIKGLMGMATNTPDQEIVASEFAGLHRLLRDLSAWNGPQVEMSELSMGMSSDYPIAVKNGATMIRIGTDIFGARQYPTGA
ncbi:MAG: YggS family pyridoxal phosphate-dependent enzyme [Bacteroidota bacterium]